MAVKLKGETNFFISAELVIFKGQLHFSFKFIWLCAMSVVMNKIEHISL